MLATGKVCLLSTSSIHRWQPEPESLGWEGFPPLGAAYPTCFDTSFARFLNHDWLVTPLSLIQNIKMSQPYFTYLISKN